MDNYQKLYDKLVTVIVFELLLAVLVTFFCITLPKKKAAKQEKENVVSFEEPAYKDENGEYTSYVTYGLSNDTVLREKSYSVTERENDYRYVEEFEVDYPLPCDQRWEFKPLRAGEVTMFWQRYYDYGENVMETRCNTYYVYENGEYEKVPEEQSILVKDAFAMLEVFRQKDAEKFLDCFCENVRENRREETLREIEDAIWLMENEEVSYYEYDINHGMKVRQLRKEGEEIWRLELQFDLYTKLGKRYIATASYVYAGEEGQKYQGLEAVQLQNIYKRSVRMGEEN